MVKTSYDGDLFWRLVVISIVYLVSLLCPETTPLPLESALAAPLTTQSHISYPHEALAQLRPQRGSQRPSRFQIPRRQPKTKEREIPKPDASQSETESNDTPIPNNDKSTFFRNLFILLVIVFGGIGANMVWKFIRNRLRKKKAIQKASPSKSQKQKILSSSKSVADIQKHAEEALKQIGISKQAQPAEISSKTKQRISAVISRLVEKDGETDIAPLTADQCASLDSLGEEITNPGIQPQADDKKADEITNIDIAPNEQQGKILRITVDLEDLFIPADFDPGQSANQPDGPSPSTGNSKNPTPAETNKNK